MRDKRDGGAEQLKLYKDNGCTLFIDSGAHTFFSELGMGHGVVVTKDTKTKESYEEYFQKYLDWLRLRTTEGVIDHYVELDIQEIVGQEQVWKWRNIMRDNKLNPIVVLHPKASASEGGPDKEWDKITSEFNYCAIEGSLPTNRYISWLTVSEKKNVRVHGFAMTKIDEMRRCKFYSVDSTSWISGSRFGGTYYWKGGGRMDGFGPDEKKARVRFKYELVNKAGVDWDKLEQDNNAEIDRMNCYAWRQFADWANQALLCNYERNVEGLGTRTAQVDRTGVDDRAVEGEAEDQGLDRTPDSSEAEEGVDRGIPEGEQGSMEQVGERLQESIPDASVINASVPTSSESDIGKGEGEVKEKPSGEVSSGKPTMELKRVNDSNLGEHLGSIQAKLKSDPSLELKRRKSVALSNEAGTKNLKHGRYASDPVIYCRENCPKKDLCKWYKENAICYFDARWRPLVERIQSNQPEVILEALVMFVRTQLPRLAKNQGFEELDGGYIDKNVTVLADRLFTWMKDIHILMTPKTPLIQVGGDLTIQRIENIVDRLPSDKAQKLGEVLAEIECIDVTGDEVEGEDKAEVEVVKEKEKEEAR